MKNFFTWGFLYYLRFFAKLAVYLNKPKIIGITGSVGKSSTRNALYALMKDYFRVKVIKEGNSETGIPLGILGLTPGSYRLLDWLKVMIVAPFKINNLKNLEYLIVEMGIDSPEPPKNMDYLLTIIKPDISIVLNVHPVHTMQFDHLFGNIKNDKRRLETVLARIRREKMKIVTLAHPKVAVVNENLLAGGLSGLKNTELITFGESGKASIRFTDYQVALSGTSFVFGDAKFLIRKFVLPKGYLEVFAASFAVGKYLGLTEKQITGGLAKNFSMPKGRGSIFEGINSSIIIDSSYNASKAAVLTFLEMAKQLSLKDNRPLILLLGDMRELGRVSQLEHQLVADKINESKVAGIYCVGSLTKKYVIPRIKTAGEVKWFKTSLLAGEYLRRSLPQRSLVLVKGSQNEIFLEEAVKKILKNNSDSKNLCRQNPYWIKHKEDYFQGV